VAWTSTFLIHELHELLASTEEDGNNLSIEDPVGWITSNNPSHSELEDLAVQALANNLAEISVPSAAALPPDRKKRVAD